MKLHKKDKPFTVAEVCFSKSWGGLEHYFFNSIQRLSNLGCEVIPFLNPQSAAVGKLETLGFKPITLDSHDYISPLTTLRLRRAFREHSVDAIHLHRTQDLGIVIPAADLASVSHRVLTLQMESDRRKRDIYHRYVYGGLDNVLTITERMRGLVIKNVAVSAHKVHTLYYGIDVEGLRAEKEPSANIRQRWEVAEDAFVVGLVGRLELHKGQRVLLEAAGRLEDKIPGLTVILVGEETVGQTGELEQLRTLAESLQPKVNTIFTGYIYPPGSIVPAFDLSVLASRKETFGLVIIESMALGVPVVATNAGGVPEIIDHGVDGMLVNPEDATVLADAIYELYLDKEKVRTLGKASIEKVQTKFGLERHMKGLVEALKG